MTISVGTDTSQITERLAWPIYNVGEINLNVRDEDGIDWVVQTETGWASTPTVRSTFTDRSGTDGAWDGETYFGTRVITLTGVVIAPTHLQMVTAKERFLGVFPGRGRAVLTVYDVHVTRQVEVRRTDFRTEDRGALAFRWSLTVTAPDPLRYSSALHTNGNTLKPPRGGLAPPFTPPIVVPITAQGGSVTVINSGNYRTPTTITIRGPISAPKVLNRTSGQALVYGLDIARGQSLVIDTGIGSSMFEGTAYRAPEVASSIVADFRLDPGANEVQLVGDVSVEAGAVQYVPELIVAWRDAWQ